MAGTREALDVEIHHAVDDERHHLPEEIGVGALLNEVFQSHPVDGHGIRVLSVRVCKPEQTVSRLMTDLQGLWTTGTRSGCPRRRCSPVGFPPRNAAAPVSYTTPRDAPNTRDKNFPSQL